MNSFFIAVSPVRLSDKSGLPAAAGRQFQGAGVDADLAKRQLSSVDLIGTVRSRQKSIWTPSLKIRASSTDEGVRHVIPY
jgi:hypothetical protein